MFPDVSGGSQYKGLLPGDTNLSAKWRPDMEQSKVEGVQYQQQLPVSQAQTYAGGWNCRYGFIITDLHLVILRLRPDIPGDGLAKSRPQRARPQPSHRRNVSGSTVASNQFAAISIDNLSEYSDQITSLEYQCSEHAVISRGASEKRHLTIRSGFFFIRLMAADNDTIFQLDYPPLHSWRNLKNGTFRHNLSGFIGPKLPRGAKLCNPETNENNKQSYSMSRSRPSKETYDFQAGQDEVGASGAPTSYQQEGGRRHFWVAS